MTEQRILIVGAGLAGLAAALTLGHAGKPVTLIEGQSETGGLWQTYTNSQGHVFTQGVRIPEVSGISEMDALLFGDVNTPEWQVYQTLLKEGHVFNGTLNQICGCIDTTLLPEDDYNACMTDLLAANGDIDATYANNKEQLDAYYGEALTESVFRPLMMKFTGQQLEDLAPHTHRILIPQRLKMGDKQLATTLQKTPRYQAKVAHESWQDLGNQYAGRFVYPTTGESARWIDNMTERAKAMGVEVLTNTRVTRVKHGINSISGVTVCSPDGSSYDIECAGLVWTLPTSWLSTVSNIPLECSPPKLRDLHLTYLTLKQPANTDMFYMTDYDASRKMFRAMFLDNLTPHPHDQPYRVIIETYADPERREDSQALQKQVINELCDTGVIVDGLNGIDHQEHVIHRNIIPIYTPQQRATLVDHTEFLQQQFSNLIISGRGSLNAFFAPQVFKEIYSAVQKWTDRGDPAENSLQGQSSAAAPAA